MLNTEFWALAIGLLLLFMVLGENFFKTKAISTAIVYLCIGYALGPDVASILKLDPMIDAKKIEIVAEVVILISLFSAGLKMSTPFRHSHWRLSLNLATFTMVSTVAFIAVAGHYIAGLPWPVGILLGGILAPTDPVLASAVQVQDANDDNRLRTGLTGEAGLNDGTAFPVVMLGLALLGLHIQGQSLWQWAWMDLLWPTFAGLLSGYAVGWLGTKAIVLVHPNNEDELVIADFVSIGLIALAYAVAIYAKGYGFLAVFACGLAFSRVERSHFEARAKRNDTTFAPALIKFTSQLERIGEVATVVLLGTLLSYVDFEWSNFLFAMVLIFGVRPLAVYLTTQGNKMSIKEKSLISWFGIRGIGSIYYLMYCLEHGVVGESADRIIGLALTTITLSIVVHGISANPFMRRYNQLAAKSKT